jgi:hypothetical protein
MGLEHEECDLCQLAAPTAVSCRAVQFAVWLSRQLPAVASRFTKPIKCFHVGTLRFSEHFRKLSWFYRSLTAVRATFKGCNWINGTSRIPRGRPQTAAGLMSFVSWRYWVVNTTVTFGKPTVTLHYIRLQPNSARTFPYQLYLRVSGFLLGILALSNWTGRLYRNVAMGLPLYGALYHIRTDSSVASTRKSDMTTEL